MSWKNFTNLYNYKYQGQERQDELGLNWDSFKWRNYDYAIGRFMSIDPLAEKYPYNSTYAFQENKMGMGRELEGLELVAHHWMKDASENENGLGAHMLGIVNGINNAIMGVVNAVTQPKETLEGLGNLMIPSPFPGGSLSVDATFGTNSTGAKMNAVNSLVESTKAVVNGNGFERGTVIGEVGATFIGAKGLNYSTKTVNGFINANKTSKLFRAVSTAELTDIDANGLRTGSGGYETSKLFTTTAQNASRFGQLNYSFDKTPNTIIQVSVSKNVMKSATQFSADGMPAIAIPADQLKNIKKVKPLNYSPR